MGALALVTRGVLLPAVRRVDATLLSPDVEEDDDAAESLVVGSDTTCNLLFSVLLLFRDDIENSGFVVGWWMLAAFVLMAVMAEGADVNAATISTVDRIPLSRNALEAYSTTNHSSINLVRRCIAVMV